MTGQLGVRRHLGPFGAVICGFPHDGALDDDDAAVLRALLAEHRALLIPDVATTAAAQLRASSALGPLVGHQPSVTGRRKLPEMRIQSPGGDGSAAGTYSDRWHSDTSWARRPAQVTLLHRRGPERRGGATRVLRRTLVLR